MSDGGLRLQVDTQELASEDMAAVFQLKGGMGWFYFHENPIKEVDTKSLPPIKLEKGQKTPSERLRATMYVFWEQNKVAESFDSYYTNQIEKWINQIKEKLV